MVLGTVNSPACTSFHTQVPRLLELVGLGYTGWFTYRYLLFKSSREELLDDIESLKSKIAGEIESK